MNVLEAFFRSCVILLQVKNVRQQKYQSNYITNEKQNCITKTKNQNSESEGRSSLPLHPCCVARVASTCPCKRNRKKITEYQSIFIINQRRI